MARYLTLDGTSPDDVRPITLGDVEVILRTRWAERTQSWCLDLTTTDGVSLARGLRLSPGGDLLAGRGIPQLRGRRLLCIGPDPYRREDLTEGRVRLLDLAADEVPPGPPDPAGPIVVVLS